MSNKRICKHNGCNKRGNYNINDNKLKKAPRQGIEPWFSDLESDVLTIERPRISEYN